VTALFNFLAGEERDIRVAIGCFGGRHRSVAMTEVVSRILRETFVPEMEQVLVNHRELGR
jgi:RNase adaptor protein for sRNA GlmZ degradation